MANSKELMTLAKKLGQAAVAIGPVVALAEPVADWAKDKIDERGELIEVPRLYSKGFPVSLSDGVATVTAAGAYCYNKQVASLCRSRKVSGLRRSANRKKRPSAGPKGQSQKQRRFKLYYGRCHFREPAEV